MSAEPVLRVFAPHLARVRGRLLLAGGCVLGVAATDVLAPWPVKLLFDQILLDRPLSGTLARWTHPWLAGHKPGAAAVLALALVAVALLRGSFAYGQLYLTSRVGAEAVHALRCALFAHLQRLSLAFHTRTHSGELLTKVAGDTRTLKDVFTQSTVAFAGDLVTMVGMLAVMVTLSWRLTLVVAAVLPLLGVTLRYLFREIRASVRRQREQEGQVATRLTDMLAGIPLVQAFGRERDEMTRFEAESTRALDENVRTARMEAAVSRSAELLAATGTAAALVIGALEVLDGRMTPGALLVFTAYLAAMSRPLRRLTRLSTSFSKAMVSARRIADVLATEPDVHDAVDATVAPRLAGRIVFDRVAFEYDGDRTVLRDVSFTVEAGETVAVLGPSGVGKSTIASLLLRFYDPAAGRILVDGTDVRRYTVASLRAQIAVVLQDSLLFAGSVRENLAYGRPDATPAEMEAAARAAGAHDFVAALPRGYETPIGERGATLSGGQRRRLAIARALLRDGPILVLDEPTAGLDVESERRVRAALRWLTNGRTCLVITHDLETAAAADRVVILDGGRVVAEGRPADVLTGGARSRRLHGLPSSGALTPHRAVPAATVAEPRPGASGRRPEAAAPGLSTR